MLIKIFIVHSVWVVVCNAYGRPPRVTELFFQEQKESVIDRFWHMSVDLMADTLTKQTLVDKYMHVHFNSWDYETGVLAGAFLSHFQNMIKMYRKWTDKKDLQWSSLTRYYFSRTTMRRYYYYFQLMHGEFNSIISARREFYHILERKFKDKVDILTGEKQVKYRRQGVTKKPATDQIISPIPNDEDEHFKLLEEKVKEIIRKKPKMFGKDVQSELSDLDQLDEHFDEIFRKHQKQAESSVNVMAGKDRIGEIFNNTDIFDPKDLEHIERDMELRRKEKEREARDSGKQPPSAANNTPAPNDLVFKQNLRLRHYAQQRGNFSPTREGIDIDLSDIV